MTNSTLKSVFVLDTESQTYKPAAHNLIAEQAVERITTDQNAKVTDQSERHRNPDPLKCKSCKKTAEELTSRYTAAGSDSENAEEEIAHAQESEGD